MRFFSPQFAPPPQFFAPNPLDLHRSAMLTVLPDDIDRIEFCLFFIDRFNKL